MEEFRTPSRTRRRHRLRRLGRDAGDEIAKTPSTQRRIGQYLKRLVISTILISVVIAVLLGHHYTQSNARHKGLLQEFLSSYRKHYNQIVYGQPDYCEHELNTQTLFAHIHQQILHQEQALQRLELLLRNDTHYTSIAIVGPSGVGKTLFARSLQQHFPWRDNVHSYAWNTHVEDEVQRFRLLRMLVENFSDCGRNLLIIDNLQPCDVELVSLVHDMIEKTDEAKEKRIVLLYIFKLNTLEEPHVYQAHNEALQKLPNTVTVNFRPFGIEELKDCITREALIENLTLSESAFDEIVATIDPTISGCKNVHAKVLVNGQQALAKQEGVVEGEGQHN